MYPRDHYSHAFNDVGVRLRDVSCAEHSVVTAGKGVQAFADGGQGVRHPGTLVGLRPGGREHMFRGEESAHEQVRCPHIGSICRMPAKLMGSAKHLNSVDVIHATV